MAYVDDVILLVKQGEELPKINESVEVVSVITQTKKKFLVKNIVDLKWNKFGDLIVELKGYYL